MAYGHPSTKTPEHWAALALNASADDVLLTALCFSISPDDDGNPPEWVELVPAGKKVSGDDGRYWYNDDPQRVLNHFLARQSRGKDLPFDFNHSTELKGPKGDEAPATGWGKAMEIREGGSIWVRPDWTERGLNAVRQREYRYLSPVLIHDQKLRILGISSVALTNKPNLNIQALNQSLTTPQTEDNDMALAKSIRQALSLDENATEADAVVAINQLQSDRNTALNSAQNPDSEKFVPMATHKLALNRAEEAEDKLEEQAKAALKSKIETAINQSLEDGKIAPADVEYFTAMCQAEGGLEKFKEYVAKTPKVVADGSGKDGKPPASGTDTALNAAGYHKPDGFSLDPERTALHNKAVAYQTEHGCDYASAAQAVGA